MRICSSLILLLAAGALAACTEVGASPGKLTSLGVEIAYMAVKPGTNVKVARIYRSASPTAAIDATTTFKPMCELDYANTTALKGIDSFVVTEAVSPAEYNDSTTQTYGGGLTGVSINPITIGASGNVTAKRSVVMTGLQNTRLMDEGQEAVAGALGTKCKDLIAQYKKKGHMVLLVTAVTIAESLTVTVTYDKAIKPTIAVQIAKNIAPGINFDLSSGQTAVAKYKNAVIELEPGNI